MPSLAAAPSTPIVKADDPAGQHQPFWPDSLTHDYQAELVQTRQRRQVSMNEGSVTHVEIFQKGGVRTSNIGRPRPLIQGVELSETNIESVIFPHRSTGSGFQSSNAITGTTDMFSSDPFVFDLSSGNLVLPEETSNSVSVSFNRNHPVPAFELKNERETLIAQYELFGEPWPLNGWPLSLEDATHMGAGLALDFCEKQSDDSTHHKIVFIR